MARVYIVESLRRKVEEDARSRCGYCLTSQEFTAMPLHLEHIIPIAAGGKTIEENLWLACPLCNGHKSTKTAGVDPETAQSVTLFNPRRQNWQIHFEWSTDGVKINGLTPVGRLQWIPYNSIISILVRPVVAGYWQVGILLKSSLK